MEQETLYTATKWDILKALADGKKSPQQLSTACKTSLANVSQQLRILELAGVVSVERLPNREKGQPRLLYGLKGNHAFLIATMPGLVEKNSLALSPLQKTTLTIWLLVEPARHAFVERAFWNLHDHWDKIDELYLDSKVLSRISLVVVSRDATLKKALKDYTIKHNDTTLTIHQSVITPQEKKSSRSLLQLYG